MTVIKMTDIDLSGKRVLIREDLNVPVANGKVTSDVRIRAALPTIKAALDAGALGAKINGSGGGGCMFAYAPNNPKKVLEAIQPFGRSWIVKVDEGTRVEPSETSRA